MAGKMPQLFPVKIKWRYVYSVHFKMMCVVRTSLLSGACRDNSIPEVTCLYDMLNICQAALVLFFVLSFRFICGVSKGRYSLHTDQLQINFNSVYE